jgi:hypothetical protein
MLLKLGIKVSKRTIQKYMRGIRTKRGGQSWASFLANHALDRRVPSIHLICLQIRKVANKGAAWKVASPFLLLDGRPAERQLRLFS